MSNSFIFNHLSFYHFTKEKENFILVVGSSNCPHCSDYQVTMSGIINEYGLDIKYINVANLSEKQNSKLNAKTHYNYSTPVTVFFEDGKIDNTSTIRGNQSKSKVIKKLTKEGYIK